MNAETKVRAGGVHRKLSVARQKFHTLKLTKTGKNTFADYSYFELGDFLVPALGVFDEVGLGAIVSFGSEIASMTIVDLDNPDDRIVITSPMGSAALKGCHEVQNIGAVETYQRRYLWVAALEIVEHDALDATNGKFAPETTERIGESELRVLQGYADAKIIDLARFCKFFQIASLKELPVNRYEEALSMAQAKQRKQLETVK